MPSVSDLYSQNPGAAPTTAAAPADMPISVAPAQATATAAQAAPGAVATQTGTGPLATARDAVATGYTAQTQDVPNSSLASSQLGSITAQDSPLMQRARQEGILSAARRGLQNSSISAGASEGAMVDRATPLASQNASQLQEQSLANQAAVNRASEVSTGRQTDVSTTNAQLGTQTSQFNSGQANENSRLNAQLGTQTSQFNAEQQNEVSRLNAQLETATAQGNAQEVNAINTRLAELRTQVGMQGADINARANELTAKAENDLRQSVLTQNSQLNQQYLAGTQAMDLEQIRGQYETLLAQNSSASSLYNGYFQAISASMSNPNLLPERAAQIVAAQQTALEAGLRMIAAMNDFSPPPAAPPITGVAPPTRIPPVSVTPTVAAPQVQQPSDGGRAAAERNYSGGGN